MNRNVSGFQVVTMKKAARYRASALLALVLCTATSLGIANDRLPPSSGYAGSYGRIVKSRTTGVAPLLVHVSADFSGDPDGGRGFRNYDYDWDFGDPESGIWGTTGNSRNRAKGGIAAHVFEKAGTYLITLNVSGGSGLVALESFIIQVEDPDQYYQGANTVCVSDGAHHDFSGAPEGALCIVTDDLGDITRYAMPGRRILFNRGSSWSVRALTWPENRGPVTIGAFGDATGVDAMGIAANAPKITVTGGVFLPLDSKQDWRIMDLRLVDPTRRNGTFGGSMEMQRILFLRLSIEGFSTSLGWSHWNTSRLMILDQMAVVSCDVSGGEDNIAYVGGERLALLGNQFRDARESHVLRVWQAYASVISDNFISGSSLESLDGRHALKLHGPGFSTFQGVNEFGNPEPETALLGKKSEFIVVSDNVFGSSGPWPVTIGPQDALTDAAMENIVFERNRIISQFGKPGRRKVDVALNFWASKSVVRNNIFDGTGSSNDYTGIVVDRRGVEPEPHDVEIYHNSIYRSDNAGGNHRIGIAVGPTATGVIIKNNIICFPKATVVVLPVQDLGTKTVQAGNLVTAVNPFLDPERGDPLSRNFRLKPGTKPTGEPVPVFEDFAGTARLAGTAMPGAF